MRQTLTQRIHIHLLELVQAYKPAFLWPLHISDKRNMINPLEGKAMDYITTKEAAAKWEITDRMALYYCTSGRIDGAVKTGNTWLIPQDAAKPKDKRRKKAPAHSEKEAPFQPL